MNHQVYDGTTPLNAAIANILKLCPIGNLNKLRDFNEEACKALGLPFGKTGIKTVEQNVAIFEWLRDNKTVAPAMPIPVVAEFDAMTSIIAEINSEHALALNAYETAKEHARRAGVLLLQVKAELPHGDFGLWLVENVTVSERQAQRYMQAARELPAPDKPKTDMVSYLKHEKSIKKIQADLSAIDTNNLSPETISEWQSIRDAVNKIKFELDNLLDDDQTPETQKPRDIAIGAACESVVKLTPIELTANHSIANSIV